MRQYTELGTAIRVGIARRGISVGELCEEITKQTGLYCDRSCISKICRGLNGSKAMIKAIKGILDIGEVG